MDTYIAYSLSLISSLTWAHNSIVRSVPASRDIMWSFRHVTNVLSHSEPRSTRYNVSLGRGSYNYFSISNLLICFASFFNFNMTKGFNIEDILSGGSKKKSGLSNYHKNLSYHSFNPSELNMFCPDSNKVGKHIFAICILWINVFSKYEHKNYELVDQITNQQFVIVQCDSKSYSNCNISLEFVPVNCIQSKLSV